MDSSDIASIGVYNLGYVFLYFVKKKTFIIAYSILPFCAHLDLNIALTVLRILHIDVNIVGEELYNFGIYERPLSR